MQNYTFFPNPPHKNPKATRRPPFMTYDSHRPAAPKVAERRRTSPLKGAGGFGRGEVRKDGNPCTPDTQNEAATV